VFFVGERACTYYNRLVLIGLISIWCSYKEVERSIYIYIYIYTERERERERERGPVREYRETLATNRLGYTSMWRRIHTLKFLEYIVVVVDLR
jgi:hypothetical protein